jgi:hypothetical protein
MSVKWWLKIRKCFKLYTQLCTAGGSDQLMSSITQSAQSVLTRILFWPMLPPLPTCCLVRHLIPSTLSSLPPLSIPCSSQWHGLRSVWHWRRHKKFSFWPSLGARRFSKLRFRLVSSASEGHSLCQTASVLLFRYDDLFVPADKVFGALLLACSTG